jgi:DNA-binding transcriptional regulator LsrR (DeoR family)
MMEFVYEFRKPRSGAEVAAVLGLKEIEVRKLVTHPDSSMEVTTTVEPPAEAVAALETATGLKRRVAV